MTERNIEMAAPTLVPSARHLLSTTGFTRVVHLVQRDNDGVEDAMATRIVDEALKFVAAAGRSTGRHLRPSKTVDMSWHALILHTAMYRELCSALGRFVDHRPEGPETLRRDADTLGRTMEAIREAGYEPDAYLWGPLADTEIQAGDCMHSECTEGGSACAAPPA
ncbi:glycine-rich domain-containing protein [Streptomyces sp. NPDC090445]|uniref:glycine-rich domain-containing protein n=1 Tax=Streptomyces sp. NPDC090445 TaxID=3365963 RepID=UPI00382EB2BC